MARDNTVTLVGNLTRTPEGKVLPSGDFICELGVAVNESRRTDDGWEDIPNYFDVTVYDSGTARNVVDSLDTGSRVMILGRMKWRTWENDEGEKRNKVTVIADTVGADLRWAQAQLTKVTGANGKDKLEEKV
jgi:single-strand DNA-binding protein